MRPRTPFRGKSTFIPPNRVQQLDTLKNETSIVIQSADKGGALVILDSAFQQEIMRQLRNDTFCWKLQGNPVSELKTKAHKCLSELLKEKLLNINTPICWLTYLSHHFLHTTQNT